MKKIKPCPFCHATGLDGNDIGFHMESVADDVRIPLFNVECGCGARGPDAKSEEGAIAKWNNWTCRRGKGGTK